MPSNKVLFPALQQAALLIAMAIAIGLGVHATSDGPALTAPVQSADSDGLRSVDTAEAQIMIDSGTAMFMDVRGAMDYMDSHLPGAGNLPLDNERQDGKPITIIIYCSDPSCGKAATMAGRMLKNGLNVMVMPEGASGWASGGGMMEMSQ